MITCPTGKLLKKLILTTAVYIPQSVFSAKYEMKLDKWNSKDLQLAVNTLWSIPSICNILLANQL